MRTEAEDHGGEARIARAFRRSLALIAAVASGTRARGGRFIWWVSKAWNVDAQQAYARLGAFSEPVVAHALFDEPFERLVDLTPSRGDGGA